MQTERVTFLTSPDLKASLDAFAAERNQSVGHVLREASVQYMSKPAGKDEAEDALALILPDLDAAVSRWGRQIDAMEASVDRAIDAVEKALKGDLE